jgi:hypothetical protein
MRKESVQKFDLEAAFKALDTVEIPTVKGIRPNREDLQEKFTHKLVTDILVEDYYDVGDTGELEQAQEEREAEVAKAKLARIEKIVDLDAETEDDILPSYVGKFIMQCPQCMTLFYKNEEDIERSEEAPDVVNINEPCQHCGNSSGYTLIGKVDTVGEEEAAQYDVDDFEENELDLNFDEEEGTNEEPVEAEEEVATEGDTEEDADLDLDLAPIEDEEEEVKESLSLTEDWDSQVAEADKILKEIIVQSNNENYDDGDGYWVDENIWGNRYLYYDNSVDNIDLVDELCDKYSTDNCQFYVFEDDAIEDPVSEIGYTLTKDVKESLTEAASLNLYPAIARRFTKAQLDSLTPEELKILQNPLKNRAAVDEIIAKYNPKHPLDEATINISRAEMEKLDKEVEEATKEVAKYKIPMKAQKNSAGQTENVPDFEAVPEAQREAAKKAYDRYSKAIAARPDRAKNIIKYTDESLTEGIDKDLDAKLKAHNDYIDYLKKMIEQEEEALGKADNEYVKKAIQRRLDAFKADLEEALPDTIKNDVVVSDLPTPEEADMEAAAENKDESKEKKESLSKDIDLDPAIAARFTKSQLDNLTPEEIKILQNPRDREAINKIIAKYNSKEKKESLTEASTTTVSKLKRKYSATEIMVKELKSIEPFNKLSTRTIQRVLLPYYIENMGRDDLSTQALVDFFEYEGFAPYVLDHFMAMDPLARKELLKADEKFMQIFNDYAAAYNFFPGKDETLEPGESEFDYAFNIMFDIGEDGQARDTRPARDAIKALSKMYVAGEYDPSVSIEELTEDAAVDVLFDSEEFKTPISDAEIDKIRAQYEGLEEDIAPGVETEIAINNIVDTWESVEDFDDETFNKLTENYLTNVYSNVKSFETTNCDLKDGKLIVEGTITFNSGKTKSTAFIYETKETADKTIVLEGLNADFASEKAFTLNCKVDAENRLIVESLNYKYTINDTLVEGLLK